MLSVRILIAVIPVCCCGLQRSEATEKPNVLIVITDEHNFRTLGCYREVLPPHQAEMWGPGCVVPTPNIDSLAHDGLLCTRAYATSPVCSPCRGAMITGRYPQNNGVAANDEKLDRSIPTLADRLNAVGYRSGFIGKWHLEARESRNGLRTLTAGSRSRNSCSTEVTGRSWF
ncbi:MAG: sulfatase-like hydrolase/transferase [Planctomycetaceae bacterium]